MMSYIIAYNILTIMIRFFFFFFAFPKVVTYIKSLISCLFPIQLD